MGDPIDLPYNDNFGNVFQDSVSGTAMWLRAYNANFWLPKPEGVGLVMPPSMVEQPGFPPVPATAPIAADPAGEAAEAAAQTGIQADQPAATANA